jgi:hypothetical protein
VFSTTHEVLEYNMLHFFSSDNATTTVLDFLSAAEQNWVSFTYANGSEIWYRTKKFGEQWGIIMSSYDEDGEENDIDICIADMDLIRGETEDDIGRLDHLCLIEDVLGRSGLRFLIWVKGVILQMQAGQVPNWEDPVRGIVLSPSDNRRAKAYRRMKRHGFLERANGDFVWTK